MSTTTGRRASTDTAHFLTGHWSLSEGEQPNPEQLATLSNIYRTLANHFSFAVASFEGVLLDHSNIIMGKLVA